MLAVAAVAFGAGMVGIATGAATDDGLVVRIALGLLLGAFVLLSSATALGRSIADEPPDEHVIRRFRRALERDLRRQRRLH